MKNAKNIKKTIEPVTVDSERDLLNKQDEFCRIRSPTSMLAAKPRVNTLTLTSLRQTLTTPNSGRRRPEPENNLIFEI